MAFVLLTSVLSSSALLLGCEEPPPVEPVVAPTNEETPPRGYEVIEFDDGGSIAGHVRFIGPRPEVDMLPVRQDHEACGEAQPSPALRVSERGGVADAVVTLMDIDRGKPRPEGAEIQVLRLEGCRFGPHVQVVLEGSSLRLENGDDLLHNAHGFDEARDTVFDVGLPHRGSAAERTLWAPGVVRVVCDAGHTFEHAFVHVVPHPYAAVTGPDGAFRLLNVPPGQYVLQVWHEGWLIAGTERGRPRYSSPVVMTRTLSVSVRQETTVDFVLSQHAAELAGDG